MKMSKHVFHKLQFAINTLLEENPDAVERYSIGDFDRSDLVKDLQKRFCFDCLYSAIDSGLISWDTLCGNNLSDDHIYTALKRICPTIEKRY